MAHVLNLISGSTIAGIIYRLGLVYGLCFGYALEIRGDNLMQIGVYQSEMNDTLNLELEIVNSEPFISFQCDLLIPSNFLFISSSAALTDRATDHLLIESGFGPNRIRVFSYSNSNSQFLGNEGAVFSFKIYTGTITGGFMVEIAEAIIGNAQSQNILNDVSNGSVMIASSGINHNSTNLGNVRFFPNPFQDVLYIEAHITEPVDVMLNIYKMDGTNINKVDIGILSPGSFTTVIATETMGIVRKELMLFELVAESKSGEINRFMQKIFSSY